MGAGGAAEPSIVAPMPSVLGDDSSSSKGEDDGGGDGSLPSKVEVGSLDHRPVKAPVIEESEEEPRRESPPVQPVNPMPSIGSRRLEDTEMDPGESVLFLSKCYFLLCFCFCFAPYA